MTLFTMEEKKKIAKYIKKIFLSKEHKTKLIYSKNGEEKIIEGNVVIKDLSISYVFDIPSDSQVLYIEFDGIEVRQKGKVYFKEEGIVTLNVFSF